MPAKKVLYNNAGQITEYQAVISSAGAGNSGDIPALDSTGRLDMSVMPSGIGSTTITVTASEALSAGNFVNLWNNAGTLNVRKADNTATGKEADGYVLAAVSNGATATVYLSGLNNQCTSLTVGSTYYLGTGGAPTTTAPSSTGNVVQELGFAVSATAIEFAGKSRTVVLA
jgi:hypothetical protein